MNPNGILTTYEERMKANLQQYQRPEKAGTFLVRLDHRTWGKHMCLFCYFTDMDTSEKIRLACWRGAGERYREGQSVCCETRGFSHRLHSLSRQQHPKSGPNRKEEESSV